MPRYISPSLDLKNFRELGFRQFIEDCYSKSFDEEHRNLLIFLFLTGIRPIELHIKREDIRITKNAIEVIVKTAKGGNKRLIILPIVNAYLRDLAIYIAKKNMPKEYIFPTFCFRKNCRDYFLRVNKKFGIGVYGLDGTLYPYSFYFFRHNILTLLARYGADLIQLLFFKGASLKYIFRSAGFYIHMSRSISKQISKILKDIILNS